MKRVGIFVEDRKFNDLGFKTFIETKRPDDVVQFVQIVESKPFDSQDPFDLIIHKSFHLLEKNKDKYAQFQSQSVPNINDLDVDKELIKRAVDALRTHLGLDLINIDFVVLSKADHKQRLAIIDVNIFPNYKCVPDFFFHLENLVREKLNLPKLTSPEIFKQ
ncbi:unnamed protein product [Hymenolepis diminuta]|uniref:Inositol-1,3,4-trisphosphate 5/6-kinase n=1 Tax=Hymenolepis diminuta TaxID=6216 RepID=A0A0R3SPH9_HYMDI|nr:unnamed protein product [Hymenolepis diminuta]